MVKEEKKLKKKSKKIIDSEESYENLDESISIEEMEPPLKVKKTKEEKFTKSKKSKSDDSNDSKDPSIIAIDSMNSTPISNFQLSSNTITALSNRGIATLFPIQAATFNHIFQGQDLIGRAKTGQGKTLAFCLPILEQLIAKNQIRNGVLPRVLIMSPTRELAKQILEEFTSLSTTLRIEAIYGGTSLRDNYDILRRGVDVIVGTPGRVKDLLEKGNLKFSSIEHVVLDEADQMLDMGFQDEISYIFEQINTSDLKKQVLLFSATMPSWVHNIAEKYMSKSRKIIDLVGDSKQKAVTTVRHIAIPYQWTAVGNILNDVIAMYAGRTGKVIVFCGTKNDCDTIAMDKAIKYECHVLHGDIPQAKRESTLNAFKSASFRVLVATDVAARGLDLSVELVVQVKPPIKMSGNVDVENYVHRSGRTGRAGKSGICVTLFAQKTKYAVEDIERSIGNKFEWLAPPQPIDVLIGSGIQCAEELHEIDKLVLPYFKDTAKMLINSMGAENALCAALARITGFSEKPKSRSLLSSTDGMITLQFHSNKEIQNHGYVFGALNRVFPQTMTQPIKGMKLSKDRKSACFDILEEHIDLVNEEIEKMVGFKWLSICSDLPPLEEYDNFNSRGSFGGRGGGGRGGSGNNSGGGRGGRGGRSGFKSGGGFSRNTNNFVSGSSGGFGKRKREFE